MSVDLERAQFMARMGDPRGAMRILVRLLTSDPADAEAHALLASVLLDLNRLHGAETEAREALRSMPDHPLALLVLALVHVRRRELGKARDVLNAARTAHPLWSRPVVVQARVESLAGRRRKAEAYAREARSLDPEDPEIPALLAELASDAGRPREARQHAREALALDPEDDVAHSVMAQVELMDDHPREAREHALAALRVDPADVRALSVLGGLRARGNLLLGLWWRFNRALMRLGQERAMLVLVVVLVVVNLAMQLLDDGGYPGVASIVWWSFLGFCIYTWVGPGMYRRQLQRELDDVDLAEDY